MRLLAFDEVDSTMLEADRQVATGTPEPFLVWAESQTGGRGRYGRSWASPPGNLYWTLVLGRGSAWPKDFGLTFAAGLAIADTLEAVGVPGRQVQMKWPNDCLLDGRKIAGTLIRTSFTSDPAVGAGHVVVGIGINVASSPEDTFFPATSLEEAGFPGVGVASMRDLLTDSFMRRAAQWEAGGYPAIREEFESRLHGVGQSVRVALDRERRVVTEGVSGGMDSQGGLRLRRPDDSWNVVTAGDVLPAL